MTKGYVLFSFSLVLVAMLLFVGQASAAGGVELFFADGTTQTSGGDCHGRYEDNGDGTVTDCRTGMIWLKNANCTETSGGIIKTNGDLNWAEAGTWAAELDDGICGLTDGSTAGDWRLPTKTEWMAMVQSAMKHGYLNPSLTNAAGTGQWTAGDIFDNVRSDGYWSSTTYAPNTAGALFVNMNGGNMVVSNKANDFYVWPVRAGQ